MSHVRKKKPEHRLEAGNILVLMGKPCAGKGTAAEVLGEEGGLKHGVCSHIIMTAAKDSPELKQELQQLRDAGELWGDGLVNKHTLNHVTKHLALGNILDGYPRTIAQAETLLSYARCVKAEVLVVEINVSDRVSESRRQARIKDYKRRGLKPRKDDRKRIHAGRVRDYNSYSPAILDFFKSQPHVRFKKVDGTLSEEEVRSEIREFARIRVAA